MRYLILILVVALLLRAESETKSGFLDGSIISKSTKKPLTGVLVNAFSPAKKYTAVTDRHGNFSIAVEPGTYIISFAYIVNSDTTIRDVTIETGKPATFKLELEPDIDNYDRSKTKAIEKPEYPGVTDDTEYEPTIDTVGTITLEKGFGGIIGTVTDTSGKSIEGATVRVLGTKKGTYVQNEKGVYALKNLSPGNFNIVATFLGFKTTEEVVSIYPDKVLNHNIVMKSLPESERIKVLSAKSKRIITSDEVIYGASAESKVSKISDRSKETSGGSGATMEDSPLNPRAEKKSWLGSLFDGKSDSKSDALAPAAEIASGSYNREVGKAGVLTSGEINDFRKWELWKDIEENQLKAHRLEWTFTLQDRYTVQLVNSDNRPVIDCPVKLLSAQGNIIWEARTDNTGKAELWRNIYPADNFPDKLLSLEINYNGNIKTVRNPTKFHDGINMMKLDSRCDNPKNVDIVFAVDATGSMGDEINYLKAELLDVIQKISEKHKDKQINLGSVFYRDIGDDYVLRKSDISSDIKKTSDFIKEQSANGGGDEPESVELALQTAVNELSWSPNAVARIMFIILDAAPHNLTEVRDRLREVVAKAALSGIRIIPVTCSGINKSAEYLMRSIALATNGSYVFLTDDSRVGGSHIKPTTDKYDVELLNDLFFRLIDQFTTVPSCDKENPIAETGSKENIFNQDEKTESKAPTEVPDIMKMLNCYPNPTTGELTIEIAKDLEEMFLTDLSGKLLQKFDRVAAGKQILDMTAYPTGVFFIKFRVKEVWGCVKILLVR
ncbi:MAG: hypothetical protein HW421_435 [Ignavibacteria bacterium]|nr:hypothetical protein [Ignavibacteria bacterium]